MTHPHFDLSPILGGRMELDLLAGLIAGFASSLHCLAMCGGVAAALGAGRPRSAHSNGTDTVAETMTPLVLARLNRLVIAQLSRILVYVALGGVAGALGTSLIGLPFAGDLHVVLRWIAALVLIVAAYSVAEISLFGGQAGRIGARLARPIYRRLPYLHRFGPAGLGLAWGLMPCAMVYLTTFYAGLSGSAFQGALIMLGFGLGTLPMLTAAGLASTGLTALARSRGLRLTAAGALVCLAGLSASGLG